MRPMARKVSTFQQVAAVLLAGSLLLPSLSAQAPAQQAQTGAPATTAGTKDQPLFKFKVNTDLVLVNVVARDKQGNLVRDLKLSDFTVLEDGKSQQVKSFDVENPDMVQQPPVQGPSQATIEGAPPVPLKNLLASETIVPREAVKDRRLIILLFDFTSMQPDEVDRALKSAHDYVEKQMAPADFVSVITLSNSMQLVQDFTADKGALNKVLSQLNAAEGTGSESVPAAGTEGAPDTGAAYTPDDSEYSEFNNDRKLQAIASLAQVLGKLDQKKSVLYFSGGFQGTGSENQSQVRAAVNAAVRSNVSLYTVDIRGLKALPPGGSAQSASMGGRSAYSGRGVLNQITSHMDTQETLTTLAADTGGKAFLDSNDFGKAFSKVQQDTSAYYVLGYRSSNPVMDGRYRRITVKVNRSGLKLEFRSGYYGPRDFVHFTKEDRDKQMEDELMADMPSTDLPVYLSTAYFRAEGDKFYVPVSIVVPGSAISFTGNDKDQGSLDILGVVREQQFRIPIGNVRETVKLNFDGSQQARKKNVQYETGFLLPPGNFRLKFIVRENQTGKLGAFETDFTVPNYKNTPLKLSSVVLANQRVPAKKKSQSPLVREGVELIPNIAHVFTTDQQLYLYYEVYDPAKRNKDANGADPAPGIHVLTSIQFFSGKVKAYETPLMEARDLNSPQRKAASFQFEVPLSQLRPGWYTCQINVVDDNGGTFQFPRLPILVRKAQTPAPAIAPAAAPATPAAPAAPDAGAKPSL